MTPGTAGRSVILLAESIDGHRHLLHRALEKLGCQVHAVQCARSAFEAIESGISFHWAILDVPTTRHLLAELVLSVGRSKVILVSADADESLAQSMGCHYYQKPFSPSAFADDVNRRFLLNPEGRTSAEISRLSIVPLTVSMQKPSEASTAAESILRLQEALSSCEECRDRCPGISHCDRVSSVLRSGSGVE